jgi:hypothetical protein
MQVASWELIPSYKDFDPAFVDSELAAHIIEKKMKKQNV